MSARRDILEQLARGEIDVTQAAERLSGTTHYDAPPAPAAPPAPDAPPVPDAPRERSGKRWLRIHVSDLETGRSRVRVNVPLGLVQFGLKVGARFTDEVDSDLMRDVMEALHDSEVIGTLVEVEDVEDNERVHIFVD